MIYRFPEKKSIPEKIIEQLEFLKKDVDLYAPERFRQYSTAPDPLALNILETFQKYNWNNIGMHTMKKVFARGTRKLEQEVIYMLGDLFGTQKVDGYVTQGGTEGNLMGLWLARNYLRAKTSEQNIVFLKTSLSHYSVSKAADILDMKKVIDVELNDKGGMSFQALEKIIREENALGAKNFILALTLGYNKTGTIDPVAEIDLTLGKLKKEIGIEYFVHLDAAIGGFIYPFSEGEPIGFMSSSIYSISLDMHKTGFMPHTAGIFLCRKGLIEYIARPAHYLLGNKIDATVSSSRSGVVAAACWGIIKNLGREGFTERVKHCFELRDFLISLLKEKGISFRYTGDKNMNVVVFEFYSLPDMRLPKDIERKYGLIRVSLPKESIGLSFGYAFVFMPHISKEALHGFVAELCRI